MEDPYTGIFNIIKKVQYMLESQQNFTVHKKEPNKNLKLKL